MSTYRRKPFFVDAIQWTTENYQDVIDFTDGNIALTSDQQCVIVGGQTVCENDWILKFIGQEYSDSPTVTKYSFMSNHMFTEQFELEPEPEPEPEEEVQ